jgi:molybdopterin molybdotransferase
MRNFITYSESLNLINNFDFKAKTKKNNFISDCIGKTIAEDIIAMENSPKHPTSAMDGYAIKFEDQKLDFIEIIDKNPAGSVVQSSVKTATTIKTFTGSLIPDGADTLIPIENVEVIDNKIKIIKSVPKGFAIRSIGENYKKDEVLIKKGTTIGFSQIGVLASLNISHIDVYLDATVAIASTGSEVLDLGEIQTNESQIRSSNHITIEALAKKAGANIIQMGVVKDDIDSITKLLKEGLDRADIVVTTGGVSVGDYDFVQNVVKERLNAEVLFHGVLIKPGMHILVAKKDEKFILALPGFAYSSTVCAILYLLPLIYKYNNSNKKLPIVKAIINDDFKNKTDKSSFVACNINYTNGIYEVDFKGKKQGSSAILTNLLGNSALLIANPSIEYKKGDSVDVLLLEQL